MSGLKKYDYTLSGELLTVVYEFSGVSVFIHEVIDEYGDERDISFSQEVDVKAKIFAHELGERMRTHNPALS